MNEYPDGPILVPVQPQISQNIFHPHFLKPLSRHQMADALAGLLRDLGWVNLEADVQDSVDDDVESRDESAVKNSLLEFPQRGVTMLSHSK